MTHTTLWPDSYISPPPPAHWAAARPRTLVILGSTGSIGVSALKVAAAMPGFFAVRALAGGRNARLLAEQATQWRPQYLGVFDAATADALRALLPAGYTPEIVVGQEGYIFLAGLADAGTVLSAQVGAAGLRATVAAACAGKVVCLANKESLVLAGGLLRDICARTGAVILPVDSEHNALFQALAGRPVAHVRRIVLTASGGPFRGRSREDLRHIGREQALAHPNWSMGAKITIDSATLMNKGLEVMEACHLYGLPLEHVAVVVHPQSIIHSLAEFTDGSLMAHLGVPDMRMPIAHCLAWPECPAVGVAPLDLVATGSLTFAEPDPEAFPCLELARRALRERGGQSVVLNAANEVAVELFLAGRIGFLDIPALIAAAMDAHAAAHSTTHEAAHEAAHATASASAHAATLTSHGAPLCSALTGTGADTSEAGACVERILALDTATRQQAHALAGTTGIYTC